MIPLQQPTEPAHVCVTVIPPRVCRRCLRPALVILDGICGTCADELRQDAQADVAAVEALL